MVFFLTIIIFVRNILDSFVGLETWSRSPDHLKTFVCGLTLSLGLGYLGPGFGLQKSRFRKVLVSKTDISSLSYSQRYLLKVRFWGSIGFTLKKLTLKLKFIKTKTDLWEVNNISVWDTVQVEEVIIFKDPKSPVAGSIKWGLQGHHMCINLFYK